MSGAAHGGAVVTQLFVYPIKSCAPIRVDSMSFDAIGPRHDRRWTIANEKGVFVSARAEASLLRVEQRLLDDGAVEAAMAGFGSVRLDPAEVVGSRRVKIWGDHVEADRHPAGSAFFSELLGRPVSLLHFPMDAVRPVEPAYAGEGFRTAFSDGYPLLLTSESSLADLNARLVAKGEPEVAMGRFRPNVVVRGLDAPWAEDELGQFTIGAARFRHPKPCARCVVTTIDPVTGTKTAEPLRTLGEFRRRDDKVLFGINLVHLGVETITVGDGLRG